MKSDYKKPHILVYLDDLPPIGDQRQAKVHTLRELHISYMRLRSG
jgi:hypothetical protein